MPSDLIDTHHLIVRGKGKPTKATTGGYVQRFLVLGCFSFPSLFFTFRLKLLSFSSFYNTSALLSVHGGCVVHPEGTGGQRGGCIPSW